MSAPPFPSEENDFLFEHIALLRASFKHWFNRELLPERMTDTEAARYAFNAPWALLSHSTDKDPLFNYANQTALSLFGMTWEEMTTFPSRLSVEKTARESRIKLLEEVAAHGCVEGYRGIRIGPHGRRFEIQGTHIWNVRDAFGKPCGQAASFKHWIWL